MSELQTMLGDTVNRIFAENVTQELLEAAERGEWPADLWKLIEESGLTRPHLSEESGGAGATWMDAYTIIHACGLHAVPLPLPETILASWLLNKAGIEVPPGPLSIMIAPPTEKSALRSLTTGRITCRDAGVPWGRRAGHVVFFVDTETETRIGLAATKDAKITHGENIAREPRDGVELIGVRMIASAETEFFPDDAWRYGAMIRSAQMAGALEAILAMSVQYAGERVQFGKPIGKFQAIQQELARLAGETAAAGIAAQAAFRAADGDAGGALSAIGEDADETSEEDFDLEDDGMAAAGPEFEIAVAKIRAGEAAGIGPGIAHQVHGAIGFTYEHRLHFFTRRLWSWRAEFGPEHEWAEIIGLQALERGADELWPFVTGR